MKIETFLDYESILAGHAAPVHLALRFTGPELASGRTRPIAFCAVIDRSGSMSGEPLARAREAVKMVVRNLRKEDLFSLVIFDDHPMTLIPLQSITDKEAACRAIDRIDSGGSTNLTGGWMLGRDALKKAPAGTPCRLLLLSDGHLNVGITDPGQVRQLVAQGLEQNGIRTSSLGLGDGYFEDLLSEMATATGGAFYDANDPEKLPGIFEAELEGMQRITVQNLRLRMRRSDFCAAALLLSDYPYVEHPGGWVEVSVGDLVSEEQRTLVIGMDVLAIPPLPDGTPAASVEGEKLLDLEVLWDEITADAVASHSEQRCIRILPVQDEKDVVQNVEIVPMVAAQRAGRAVRDAIGDVDRGRVAEALEFLDRTVRQIESYGTGTDLTDALRLLHDTIGNLRLDDGLTAGTRKAAIYHSRSLRNMSSSEHWSGPAEFTPTFKRRKAEEIRKKREAERRGQSGEE